jgi:hypothetical protein
LFPPEVIERFREFQPYQRGNRYASHELWTLNNLWNADKHRQLVVAYFNLAEFEVLLPSGIQGARVEKLENYRGELKRDVTLARFRVTPPSPNVSFKGNATMEIVFRDRLPNSKLLSMGDLQNIYSFVSNEVVPAFEPFIPTS